MNEIRAQLSQIWQSIQGTLFPWLCEELGELTEKQQLVTVLEVARLEEHIPSFGRFPGLPLEDRIALARAFVAKAVYNMPTTRALRDRLASDVKLRRLCGWERRARGAERVDLFAGLCGVCRKPPTRARASGHYRVPLCSAIGRSPCSGLPGYRSA